MLVSGVEVETRSRGSGRFTLINKQNRNMFNSLYSFQFHIGCTFNRTSLISHYSEDPDTTRVPYKLPQCVLHSTVIRYTLSKNRVGGLSFTKKGWVFRHVLLVLVFTLHLLFPLLFFFSVFTFSDPLLFVFQFPTPFFI